ncbi:hypothetical protein QYE76_028908 [Lolium multiflorum]|uniref:Uncharacterized protein n=1 Tax=Lolium multiflorum TaxID=4521 RepID=A0AAD8QLT8_LOLMU|nr:hypothetical protein QYE76_028908 [Lolium multiflorum]
MAEETPVTYEELTGELKKKYDEVKVLLEADLIGSFHRTRSHGIDGRGSHLMARLMEWTYPPRQRNAPGDHEPSVLSVRTSPRDSPRGVATPVPSTAAALAAPEAPNSSAYVVYKIGGDPSDYQFLQTRPRRSRTGSAPAAITADQICTILKDQFGMMPKRKAIGYTKPYPNEYELIPLPPKYRLPDFTKFSGSDGSSSIEHVSRYLAQLGMISASDELRVRYFSQSLTGSAFGWYTSLPPNSIRTGSSWKNGSMSNITQRLPRLALPI